MSNLKKMIWSGWMGSGGSIPGTGLIRDLYQQDGNSGDDIRISIRPIADSQGNWSANVAYSAREIRTYPTGSELFWISNQSTNMGESPYTNPEKWDLAMGLDFIQNIGGGKWSRVTLQRNVDEWVRENNFAVGTYANASFVDNQKNYDDNTAINETSGSTVSVPTTHPSSRSFTISTGLATIPDSTTLGTCNDTFSVPTARSQTLSINLPSGLGLLSGNYVTLYGNSSNFFIYGIITYNNTTGAAFGFCINFVGTGSFSSWTVKREVLLYAFQTGAETSRNFQFLVQTYVSGTGVVTGNSITHIGSGSASTWTILRSKVSNGIPATQSSFLNRSGAPLEAIGCSFTGSFTGSGLTLSTQGNTTGTGWMVYYVDGPDIANPPAPVTIDTYNGSLVNQVDHVIWSQLTEVPRGSVNEHKFIAVSVTSPNGSSTNTRAFIHASTGAFFVSMKVTVDYDKFTNDFSVGLAGSQSLGETVLIFAPTSSDPVVTWPYHGDLTDNNTLKKFFIDNVEITPSGDATVNTYLRRYIPFTTAYVEQEGTIVHPSFLGMGDFFSYESKHYFDKYGFSLEKLRIEILQSVYVGQWYPNLLAIVDSYIFPGRVIAQDGETMEWPNSGVTTNMSSTFKGQNNYMFESDANPDYVCVMFWPDLTNWRIGEAGRGNDHIENLVGSSSKFRPYSVFEYSGLPVGYVMNIKARIYVGNKGTL